MAAEAERSFQNFQQEDQNEYNRRKLRLSEEFDCLKICLEEGWRPENSDVQRLVRLKDRVRRRVTSDFYPVDKKQDFVRWLVNQGKLSDQ